MLFSDIYIWYKGKHLSQSLKKKFEEEQTTTKQKHSNKDGGLQFLDYFLR